MPIVNTNIAETINITENGQHDVAKYTTANVSVAGVPRTVDANGVLQMPTTLPDFNDFLGGATDIGYYAFYAAFNANLTGYISSVTGSVNLSSLTTISGTRACYQMFNKCTGITSVDLGSLTTVSGEYACQTMFQGCTGITSVDLSSLTTLSGTNACFGMFNGCTGITSVNLSNLTTVSASGACYQMFYGCTGITSVDLSSLTTINNNNACYQMFRNCTNLTSISFPALTSTSFGSAYANQFSGMLSGVTGCTLHFPSNLDPQGGSTVISGLYGYPNFGGTNTTVLFDLPSTGS